jgi:hypothetical protein
MAVRTPNWMIGAVGSHRAQPARPAGHRHLGAPDLLGARILADARPLCLGNAGSVRMSSWPEAIQHDGYFVVRLHVFTVEEGGQNRHVHPA